MSGAEVFIVLLASYYLGYRRGRLSTAPRPSWVTCDEDETFDGTPCCATWWNYDARDWQHEPECQSEPTP